MISHLFGLRFVMHFRLTILILLLLGSMFRPLPSRGAESLAEQDAKLLDRYLKTLAAGTPADAAMVDRLADLPFTGLKATMEAYAALPDDAQPHTERALQALLERMSRTALAPWPLVTLYSPEFAEFLLQSPEPESLPSRLFLRLLASAPSRQADDLIVRLCPISSLEFLGAGPAKARTQLLEAWNRRLADRTERRPFPQLTAKLKRIAAQYVLRDDLHAPAELLSAQLRFLGSWPELRSEYETALAKCLDSDEAGLIQVGLDVQRQAPALLDRNAGIVVKVLDAKNLPVAARDKIVAAALRNFAFESSVDHSATLRQLWNLPGLTNNKLKYDCLFAMGMHPQGNDALALAAVQAGAYEFIDVAMPILVAGDPKLAAAAVGHVLHHSERGNEEALRLARTLKLPGFEQEALTIAQDAKRDQVLRQSALLYLQLASGSVRRELLPLLATKNGDIRLSAIQMFAEPAGLTAEDKNEIGPTLIRVAQDDVSFGHRQEAIFTLAGWADPLAEPFFRQVLEQNPAVQIVDGHYNDKAYWRYRFRLVALLGLARLKDQAARQELVAMHDAGGPTERMDVLLAFHELREAPDWAFEDLAADEPKLIATAARLIDEQGSPEQRSRLRQEFRAAPLWKEFEHSGLDDNGILGFTGLHEEVSP